MSKSYEPLHFLGRLQSVVEPQLGGRDPRDVSFAEGWHAGVLYKGGWQVRLRADDAEWGAALGDHGEYAVVGADPDAMTPYQPPDTLVEQFARLSLEKVGPADWPTFPHKWDAVSAAAMRRFLERWGPLTDSFLRDGEDQDQERIRNAERDARGTQWQFQFTSAVLAVRKAIKEPDGLGTAWLLLDEAPQFTLLKIIALQTFSLLLADKLAMCPCGTPFIRGNPKQLYHDPSCGNRFRVRKHRAKPPARRGASRG
jgi:hypothetical protein